MATNANTAAQQQKNHYDKNSVTQIFSFGPVNLKITDGKQTRVVYMNQIQYCVQPQW